MTDPMGRAVRPLTELRGYIPEPTLPCTATTVFTEFTRGSPPEPTLPQPLLLTPSRGYVSLSSSPHQRADPPLRSFGRMRSHLDWPGVCAGQSAGVPFYRAPRPQPCARIPGDAGLRGEPASAACPRLRSRRRGLPPRRCSAGTPQPPAGLGTWRSAYPRPSCGTSASSRSAPARPSASPTSPGPR